MADSKDERSGAAAPRPTTIPTEAERASETQHHINMLTQAFFTPQQAISAVSTAEEIVQGLEQIVETVTAKPAVKPAVKPTLKPAPTPMKKGG